MDLSDIFKGRKILITGDTGFKGSWLALWLYKLGATVIGVGLEPKTPRDNYCVCGLESVISHHTCDIRQNNKILENFCCNKT